MSRQTGYHLYGHKYFGPNGPINNGEPIDYDDKLAEEHDLAYHVATTTEEIRVADRNAIMAFSADAVVNKNWHSMLGAAAIAAKYAAESVVDVVYPKRVSPWFPSRDPHEAREPIVRQIVSLDDRESGTPPVTHHRQVYPEEYRAHQLERMGKQKLEQKQAVAAIESAYCEALGGEYLTSKREKYQHAQMGEMERREKWVQAEWKRASQPQTSSRPEGEPIPSDHGFLLKPKERSPWGDPNAMFNSRRVALPEVPSQKVPGLENSEPEASAPVEEPLPPYAPPTMHVPLRMRGGMAGDEGAVGGETHSYTAVTRPPVDTGDSDAALELRDLWDAASEEFLRNCKESKVGQEKAVSALKPISEAVTSILRRVVHMDLRIKMLEGVEASRADLVEKQNQDLTVVLRQIAASLETATTVPIGATTTPVAASRTAAPRPVGQASEARTMQPQVQPRTQSYAAMARAPPPPPKHLVVVRPAEENTSVSSAEDVERTLAEKVDPKSKGWQLVSIRKGRDRKVILEAASLQEARKIMADTGAGGAGLKMELMPKRKPHLVISGIREDSLTVEQLQAAVRNQNFPNISEAQFSSRFIPKRKIRRGEGRPVSWEVEVETELYKAILRNAYLYVGWCRCQVTPFVPVLRCYRCARVGHRSVDCTVCLPGEECCKRCGEKGHKVVVCLKPKAEIECMSCKMAKKPIKHVTGDSNCWAYNKAKEAILVATDYGQ